MNQKELLELVKTGEGYTLEFKEGLSSSLSKEICAFANASGGKIILGIKDNGDIAGFNLTNAIKSQIQDAARNIDPSLPINVEKVSDMAVIYIPEGKEKPYFSGGHCYLRQGSNSQQLKRDEIRGFFQKENLIQFDRKANPDFDSKDFNIEAFDQFIKKTKIDNSLSQEHVLKNIGLITENKLNNAGVLFFSKNIGKYFLNAIIGCVLYAGKTKTKILDKQELEIDFVSNLNNAVQFSLRNLRTEYIIEKIEREEKLEIPEEILRELIVNAMVHRDYFSNARVLIEIFSDRVEISNPGGLLFDKSEFGKRSLARNPLLADVVHRLRIVEKVGSGINRVKDTLKNKVNFELFPDWFRVTISRDDTKKEPVNAPVKEPVNAPVKLTKLQKEIIHEIRKFNAITYEELSNKLRSHRTTIMRNINKLKKAGILKRIGSDKTGHWEIQNA